MRSSNIYTHTPWLSYVQLLCVMMSLHSVCALLHLMLMAADSHRPLSLPICDALYTQAQTAALRELPL